MLQQAYWIMSRRQCICRIVQLHTSMPALRSPDRASTLLLLGPSVATSLVSGALMFSGSGCRRDGGMTVCRE